MSRIVDLLRLRRVASEATLAAVAVIALSGVGCASNRIIDDRPDRNEVPNPTRPPITEEMARKFGFITYWDSFIENEVIVGLQIEGDFEQGFGKPQLYAITQSNRVYQIDLHSGMINWVYDVGRPVAFLDRRPIAEWIYKTDKDTNFKRYDEIFFVAKDHLVALDKENGSELWTVRLPFGASCPPWTSSTHVYVGSWDDRVYAFRKDRHDIADWSWRTDGDILARGLSESPQTFAVAADGKLHAFEAGSGDPRWTFHSEQRLLLDPLAFQKLLYVPGEDYNLYVLNAIDGLLEFRHCTGQPITSHPVAVANGELDKAIYYTSGTEGVFALARRGRPRASEGNPRKTIHELLWQRKEAKRFLCRGANDVYLLEAVKAEGELFESLKITRVDAQKGKLRDTLALPAVDWVMTAPFGPANPNRDEGLLGGLLILGFRNGWVITLKEIATLPGGVVDQN
jgi:hypothetical protein